jgi:hypothetical protein
VRQTMSLNGRNCGFLRCRSGPWLSLTLPRSLETNFARIPLAKLGFSGNTVLIFCLTKTFEGDVERVWTQRTDFFERI